MAGDPALFVLDSFAVMAFLDDEIGADRVEQVLRAVQRRSARVLLTLINLGEVLYIVERERSLPIAQQVLAAIEQLPLEILPVTRVRVLDAAHIKANHAVAYADAFAVAAAREFGATVLTGDPEFHAVEHFVVVEWLAKRSEPNG